MYLGSERIEKRIPKLQAHEKDDLISAVHNYHRARPGQSAIDAANAIIDMQEAAMLEAYNWGLDRGKKGEEF